MTMDSLVYRFQRDFSFTIRINGVSLAPTNPLSDTGIPAVKSIRSMKSLDNPVPQLEIELSHLATWIQRGQPVTVDLGYNNITRRVFTGFVQDRSRKVAGCVVRALGKSFTLFRTIQIEERDVTGESVEGAIEDILDYVGLDDYTVDVESYILGSSGTEMKMQKMPASQMVQMLADIDGSRMWETNNGTLIIRRIEEIPAPTAFASYKTTDQAYAIVLDGSDREDPDYFRDHVVVTGATLDADEGDEAETLSASASLVDSGGLIQPPLPSGSHIGMEYSNHLIDTQDELEALALILLTRFARIPRYLSIEIAGDPRLDIGMTITLDFPEMGIGSSRWFVSGITHQVDMSGGYRTQLALRGGDLIGGTLTIDPVPSFSFVVEQEVMGGRVLTVLSLNAEASYDPDGTIATYSWSDNQPGTTFTSAAIQSLAADTTGWVGDWVVTLTVTDGDGASKSISQTIPYSNDSRIIIPVLYQAINNNCSVSPDGGVTNNNQSNSTCVSVDCKPADGVNSGIACFGFTNGRILRTTDYCASALTTVLAADAANGTINHIWWDKNIITRVWACTSTGRLLVSLDDGVTWAVYKDFGGTYPLSRIATPPPNGVWVFGGRGDQTSTLVQYDAEVNGNWQSIGIGGHLAADLVGASSSVTVADAASREKGELALIFKGAALPGGVSIFYCAGGANTATGIFGTGADWQRATGLTAGLSEGRFIIPDYNIGTFHAAFNNRSVWQTTNGVAYTETANVFPTNTVPWHALWFGNFLGQMPGVCIAALQDTVTPNNGYIVKSIDGFQTQVSLRPVSGINTWPASAQGKMVAVGVAGQFSADAGLVIVGSKSGMSGKAVTYKKGTAPWSTPVQLPGSASGSTWTQPSPKCLTKDLWFVIPDSAGIVFGPTPVTAGRMGAYTKDGGLSWLQVPDAYPGLAADKGQVVDYTMDAGGRVWALIHHDEPSPNYYQASLYYSDNQGDSWNNSGFPKTPATLVSNKACWPHRVICHPTDKNKIIIWANYANMRGFDTFSIGNNNGQFFYSADRGLTWSTPPGETGTNELQGGQAGAGWAYHLIWAKNGRIWILGFLDGIAVDSEMYYTDDLGVTYVEPNVLASNGIGTPLLGLFVSDGGGKVAHWWDSVSSGLTLDLYISNAAGANGSFSVSSAPRIESYEPSASAAYITSIVPDPIADAAYFITSENLSSPTRKIVKFSPISDEGQWSDLTENFTTTTHLNSVNGKAMALIPRG